MTPETKLSIPPQVMSRLVDDQTVILNLESGIYFGLDGVGQRIWESISEGKNLGQVAEAIANEYDVDAPRALEDTLEFAGELVERGLLAQ